MKILLAVDDSATGFAQVANHEPGERLLHFRASEKDTPSRRATNRDGVIDCWGIRSSPPLSFSLKYFHGAPCVLLNSFQFLPIDPGIG
jgi:hypothetical protein